MAKHAGATTAGAMTKRIGCLVSAEEYERITSLLGPTLDQAALIRAALEAAVPGLFPAYKGVKLPRL